MQPSASDRHRQFVELGCCADPLEFGRDLNAARFKNGVRETPNAQARWPPTTGTVAGQWMNTMPLHLLWHILLMEPIAYACKQTSSASI